MTVKTWANTRGVGLRSWNNRRSNWIILTRGFFPSHPASYKDLMREDERRIRGKYAYSIDWGWGPFFITTNPVSQGNPPSQARIRLSWIVWKKKFLIRWSDQRSSTIHFKVHSRIIFAWIQFLTTLISASSWRFYIFWRYLYFKSNLNCIWSQGKINRLTNNRVLGATLILNKSAPLRSFPIMFWFISQNIWSTL